MISYFREFSFKKKLTLLVTAAILLPLCIASIFFAFILDQQLKSIYANRLAAGLQLFSLVIDQQEHELTMGLAKAVNDNTLQMTMDLEIVPQLRKYLATQIKALNLSSLAVANARKEVIASDGISVSCFTENHKVQLAVQGENVLLCSITPVMRGDQHLGYVAGGVDLAHNDFMPKLRLAMSEHFIVWIEGVPALSDLSFVADGIRPDMPPIGKISDFKLAGVSYKILTKELSVGNRLSTVGIFLPSDELTQGLQQIFFVVGILVFVLFAVIMIVLQLVIRGLVSPVRQLIDASSTLEKGNYHVPVLDYKRKDEFGSLNRTFRGMAVSLQGHIENMGRMVNSRTAELAAANTALMNDMIKREKAEKEKSQLEEQLFQARKLESIGILAGGIAHDFNNLLTGVLNNISLAKMYLKPEDKAFKTLHKSEEVTRRASDLTQQLLTFAKGGVPIKRNASVSELIKESASFVLRGSNVSCEYQMPDDLWTIEADIGQISQVVHNLVINADQSMPDGGKIVITAENIELDKSHMLPLAEGRYVKVSFADQGGGIAPENLSKIFIPYFTTKKQGSGLGLATSFSIIKNHGGFITAESVPGCGATFLFYLPAASRDAADPGQVVNGFCHGGGRILFLDDDDTIRETMDDALSFLGYEVKCVADGAEVVAAYEQALTDNRPFNAVILDLTIPGGMGGVETMEKLLVLDPGVRAIVSSGYSEDPVMADFKKYGFTGVVPKPYRVEELSQVLHDILL
ncbi:MAG: response regulator [Proteobacteria bacterium]|nr:response regulator [Pseudomonadota bacterium]MBU1717021.1 response regulator [Pseudomonadota bacterium]